jgi:3-oxoacyl-[acyl-carrier-protein] synthase II
VSPLILSSAVRTCLGDGEATFRALCDGRGGVEPLRGLDPGVGVTHGYQAGDGADEFAAGAMLSECVTRAVAAAGIDTHRERVVALVGTGLRELRELERWAQGDRPPFPLERLHFGGAVRAAAPDVVEVITLSNACSASGHALALAQDLLELREADAVIVAGADTVSASMLAMISRVAAQPAEELRPFDLSRTGALLGEGAVAMVLTRDDRPGAVPLARVLATGISCDAHHETAAAPAGIRRAIEDAFMRARRRPSEVDLVVAHATGTALNDPIESELLRALYGSGRYPLVTAIKGATGHTSGAAALMSVDVAVRCLREQIVPPIVGLREPIPESEGLALVRGRSRSAILKLAQVNAFGFGGVNAVSLVEAA